MKHILFLFVIGGVLVFTFIAGAQEDINERDSLQITDWLGHAIVSIAGFIFAIFLVVTGAKLTGRIKGKEGATTYKIHKLVSISFSVIMIGSFIYGLIITSGHGSPVLTSVHGWLGVIILIFAIVQLVPCLFVKNRTRVKFPHMVFGYSLLLVVLLQVVFGLYDAILDLIKLLVLGHSITGGFTALALTWILVEMTHLTEKGIKRAKIAGFFSAFFSIIGCWVVGGYNYLIDYGPNVKPVIISSNLPWVHQIIMETKEHVFIFLPILSILLAATLIIFDHDALLLTDRKARQGILLLTSLALVMVLLMFAMGVIISFVGNSGPGGS
jgi:hypothetical protein